MRGKPLVMAIAFVIAVWSFQTEAQTTAIATGTGGDAVPTTASGSKDKRFAPGKIARDIIEETSRLMNDTAGWSQRLRELEADLKKSAPSIEASVKNIDQCLVVLRSAADRLAPDSKTRTNLLQQEHAVRELAIRAEVHAEQAIRNTAGYLGQKTAELHALNRSLEETRMRLITQIDQLQELKVQLDFNPAAAQNSDSLMGAQASLEHIRTYTADAQKLASELDNFGSTHAVAARPGDQGKSFEVIKRR